MSTFRIGQCCVCGDPDCVGCVCGNNCAFSPGHLLGTDAMTPLAAMIEAAERFIAEGNEKGYALSPGLRRLRATLALDLRDSLFLPDEAKASLLL